MLIHPDRLFPADPDTRRVAGRLYDQIASLPIISPHGHTDPAWFAENDPFPDAASLLVIPDHYIFRMLHSKGVRLEDLGIARADGAPVEQDKRAIWHRFAAHYHLFRGTPTRMWLDHAFAEQFGFTERLGPETADHYFDVINAKLATPEFRPRALFERFNIEALATTEDPLDDLRHHRAVRGSGWRGRVITTYRPDPVVDPEFEGFAANVRRLGEITGEDTTTWEGYLAALKNRRAYFREVGGATATDHGHPTAHTEDLDAGTCRKLLRKALDGAMTAAEAERFRGQMLTEMARMSLEDGMVMQLHPGSFRNHNGPLFQAFGRNVGADIPVRTDYVGGLKALLDRFGSEPGFTLIAFTLDETTYSRELAPLAGHYPALHVGPAWWFFDSPEGMRRYRETITETAGFYNTVGFNDDTRAFLSVPARHDVARRADAAFLARLVVEHRLDEDEAADLARALTYDLPKAAYRL